MRRLEVHEWVLSRDFTQLVLPVSAGTPPVLRLHLEELRWWLNETNLPFLLSFLSPHLKKIVITASWFVRPGEILAPGEERLPDWAVPVIRSAIKVLPSSLQILCIQLGSGPYAHLTEEVSALILRCGKSLQEFSTNSVLSTQAIVHLMKLPNLRTWATEQGPPQVMDLIRQGVPDGVVSLFSSLEALDLLDEAALEWLPLFEVTKSRTPPWIMAGNGLPIISYRSTLPADSSLISRFLPLTSLVNILIDMECHFRPCVSQLTDQDVERPAIAPPKLEALTLGGLPCSADTCPTTVRSLLFLSVNCTGLKHLNIHFRVANLQVDILDTLCYAYSQGLHSRPKCALEALVTGEMHFKLADHNSTLVSLGMLMVFPSLVKFNTMSTAWAELEVVMNVSRQVKGLEAVTENLMRCLNEVRESVESGAPVRSIVSSRFFGLISESGRVCIFIDVTLCSFPQDEMVRIVCEPLGEGVE